MCKKMYSEVNKLYLQKSKQKKVFKFKNPKKNLRENKFSESKVYSRCIITLKYCIGRM